MLLSFSFGVGLVFFLVFLFWSCFCSRFFHFFLPSFSNIFGLAPRNFFSNSHAFSAGNFGGAVVVAPRNHAFCHTTTLFANSHKTASHRCTVTKGDLWEFAKNVVGRRTHVFLQAPTKLPPIWLAEKRVARAWKTCGKGLGKLAGFDVSKAKQNALEKLTSAKPTPSFFLARAVQYCAYSNVGGSFWVLSQLA